MAPQNFPEEIIMEILSRLPVKSLIKFRSVSKSWLSLISRTQFAKAHLEISIKKNKGEPDSLAFGCTSETGVKLRSCNLDSFMNDLKYINAAEIYGDTVLNSLWMIGSINGLICLSVRPSEIFLWNPSIRKSKKLPPSGFTYGQFSFISTYGFGYDKVNDDYKVVETYGFTNDSCMYIADVKIYSLRSNSWKQIEGWPGAYVAGSNTVFVDGSFHWPGRSKRPWFITSLNLATEMYHEVPLPRYNVDALSELMVGVLRGCLCLFCNYTTHLDVWMMQEYGVGESWTKLACIMDIENYKYETPMPIYVSEIGTVVMNYGSTLKLYDSSDNTSNVQENSLADPEPYHEAITYIESLVLPNSELEGNQQPGQWGTKDDDWDFQQIG
ncbi:F-box/kelch-repeat protein [Forsythia ovata]|uniref:F-box/kelch-repeat protein n=1 Tax=Forsythia ovata TaxID=205694 RepID=A0ABD1UYY1_9LAMI